MNDTINSVFLGFAKRAERIEKESLMASFVNVGPLIDLLSTVEPSVSLRSKRDRQNPRARLSRRNSEAEGRLGNICRFTFGRVNGRYI
jgi:hypothetical protein